MTDACDELTPEWRLVLYVVTWSGVGVAPRAVTADSNARNSGVGAQTQDWRAPCASGTVAALFVFAVGRRNRDGGVGQGILAVLCCCWS